MENLESPVAIGSISSGAAFFQGDIGTGLTITGEELTASQVWREYMKGCGKFGLQGDIT